MTQAQALVASLVLELPVVLALALGLGWVERRRLGRVLLVAAAGTLLTHPFAWHGFRVLAPYLPYWPKAVLVEGLVALTEGLLLARVGRLGLRRGLAAGFAANAFSYLAGLGLMRLL